MHLFLSLLQGRLTCVPKYQGLRTDILNEQTCTLSNDTIAIKDRKDEKGTLQRECIFGWIKQFL